MSRSNDRVADALQELADLLAISGGDPHRVRSFEKAARAVREYPLEVDGLDAAGLDAIPSVGPHIAARILALRETGAIADLDELRAQVPPGLRALLDVPGLGPHRAHQVYEQLGVCSTGELLAAAEQHRLEALRGWGAKAQANVVRAVRRLRTAQERVQLPVAMELAGQLCERLDAVPAVARVDVAGSVRRMKETIGDIDILVASERPDEVTEAFCGLDLVEQVLARGPTRSSAVTTAGLQVDLRVVPTGTWGSALQYFTGSKAHSVHLRTIAVRLGLKLSEYGLFRDDGSPVGALTEEEVYAGLGLPWIPPVLREDRGEIEAAQAGRLPRLVQETDVRGDLHLHTTLTDGLATLEEMIAAARERGYEYCAITDHAPLLHMQRMTTEKALAQRAQIRRLEGRAGLVVLHGSELNIQADGSVDWDEEVLAGFDILVASVHSHFDLPREAMTRRLIRAIENPYVNVIGHPTGRSLGRRPAVDFDHEAVFRAAARTGTALEINSFPDRLDLDDESARRAAELGVRLAISTDAHATRHLDNLRFGVATAQRGWIRREQVINTWPLERLRRFLGKGRRAPALISRAPAPASRAPAPASRAPALTSRAPARPG